MAIESNYLVNLLRKRLKWPGANFNGIFQTQGWNIIALVIINVI